MSRKFAIVGDQGIHEKCGPGFWEELVAEIRPALHAGQFTDAVTHAVREAGKLLARHFPPESDNCDELSNELSRE